MAAQVADSGMLDFADDTLYLGEFTLSAPSLLFVFASSDIFFCLLADLTKAMRTPIPVEKPAPADLDLAP